MKLPTVKMPAWWKRWYWIQVFLAGAMIFNLVLVAFGVRQGGFAAVLPAVSGFCVGLCFAGMAANAKIYRTFELMDHMNDAMRGLMASKADEIGKAVADSLHEITTGERPTGITRH